MSTATRTTTTTTSTGKEEGTFFARRATGRREEWKRRTLAGGVALLLLGGITLFMAIERPSSSQQQPPQVPTPTATMNVSLSEKFISEPLNVIPSFQCDFNIDSPSFNFSWPAPYNLMPYDPSSNCYCIPGISCYKNGTLDSCTGKTPFAGTLFNPPWTIQDRSFGVIGKVTEGSNANGGFALLQPVSCQFPQTDEPPRSHTLKFQINPANENEIQIIASDTCTPVYNVRDTLTFDCSSLPSSSGPCDLFNQQSFNGPPSISTQGGGLPSSFTFNVSDSSWSTRQLQLSKRQSLTVPFPYFEFTLGQTFSLPGCSVFVPPVTSTTTTTTTTTTATTTTTTTVTPTQTTHTLKFQNVPAVGSVSAFVQIVSSDNCNPTINYHDILQFDCTSLSSTEGPCTLYNQQFLTNPVIITNTIANYTFDNEDLIRWGTNRPVNLGKRQGVAGGLKFPIFDFQIGNNFTLPNCILVAPPVVITTTTTTTSSSTSSTTTTTTIFISPTPTGPVAPNIPPLAPRPVFPPTTSTTTSTTLPTVSSSLTSSTTTTTTPLNPTPSLLPIVELPIVDPHGVLTPQPIALANSTTFQNQEKGSGSGPNGTVLAIGAVVILGFVAVTTSSTLITFGMVNLGGVANNAFNDRFNGGGAGGFSRSETRCLLEKGGMVVGGTALVAGGNNSNDHNSTTPGSRESQQQKQHDHHHGGGRNEGQPKASPSSSNQQGSHNNPSSHNHNHGSSHVNTSMAPTSHHSNVSPAAVKNANLSSPGNFQSIHDPMSSAFVSRQQAGSQGSSQVFFESNTSGQAKNGGGGRGGKGGNTTAGLSSPSHETEE